MDYIMKFLRNIIRKLIIEILSEETTSGIYKQTLYDIIKKELNMPEFERLKYEIYSDTDNIIFSIIETHEITKYSFMFEYVDKNLNITDTSSITAKTAAEFVKLLKNRIKDKMYDHDVICGAGLMIKFNHKFGEKTQYKVLINSANKKYYKTSELNKFLIPIVQWFEERPELLI